MRVRVMMRVTMVRVIVRVMMVRVMVRVKLSDSDWTHI